jgi:hypothetical protein
VRRRRGREAAATIRDMPPATQRRRG